MNSMARCIRVGLLWMAVLISACGGGGAGSTSTVMLYAVGGSVSGLTGAGLILQNNGGDDAAIGASGDFAFATKLPAGAAYEATVTRQPTDSTINCVVMNVGHSGVVPGNSVSTVDVHCGRVASLAYVEYVDPATQASGAIGLSIDTQTGALTMRSASQLPAGAGPQLSIVPGGNYAYDIGVSGFSIDRATGALTELSGSPFGSVPGDPICNPPPGGFCQNDTPENIFIAVQPDGKRIYAYYRQFGPCCPAIPVVSTVVAFDADSADGTLSQSMAAGAQGSAGTIGLTIDPTGHFLYLPDEGNTHTGETAAVERFAIDQTTGALSLAGTDPAATWPATFDPVSRFAYTVDPATGGIQTFAVDAHTGALTTTGTSVTAPGLSSLRVDVAGTFVFGPCTGGLCAFSLDMTSGLPTAVPGGPFAPATGSAPLAVDPGGRFLFALCSPAVCVYKPDPVSGVPTQVPGSPFTIPGVVTPTSIVVSN
jgi:6-phosphogluconolactonase